MTQMGPSTNQSRLEAHCAVVRYAHVNRIGIGLIKLGTYIKVIGIGIAIVLPFFETNVPSVSLVAWLITAVAGSASSYISGSLISAAGYIVCATNDTAVNTSPFLSDGERADAIQLHNHTG